jgi:hypothetical protein
MREGHNKPIKTAPVSNQYALSLDITFAKKHKYKQLRKSDRICCNNKKTTSFKLK